jgi:hypothetical protein
MFEDFRGEMTRESRPRRYLYSHPWFIRINKSYSRHVSQRTQSLATKQEVRRLLD